MPIVKFDIPSSVSTGKYFNASAEGYPPSGWSYSDFQVGIVYHDGPSGSVVFKTLDGHEYNVGIGAGLFAYDGPRDLTLEVSIKVPVEGTYIFRAVTGYGTPNGVVVVEYQEAYVNASRQTISLPSAKDLLPVVAVTTALAGVGYTLKKSNGALLGALAGGIIGGGYLAYKKYAEA